MKRREGSDPPDDLVAFTVDQYDRVRGALALFTGDRRLAEELAQEAFVKVCQHWERVRTMDAPGAWVHRVGMNLAISRARRRRVERRVVAQIGALRPDSTPGADACVEDDELRRAVLSLPPDDRAALVLRFHTDLSVADTATVLGIPEGTVKTRTRRAVAALRAGGLADEGAVGDAIAAVGEGGER